MRDRVYQVRATAEEMEHWRALAAAAGMPLSTLIRVRFWNVLI